MSHQHRLFLLLSPAGARVLGGTFFVPGAKFIEYLDEFPAIRLRFRLERPESGIYSRILPRSRFAWQSTLPAARLKVPRDFYVSIQQTQQRPNILPDGTVLLDLRPFMPDPARITQSHQDPLDEACALIFKLGGLMQANPDLGERLREETGISLFWDEDVDEEDAGPEGDPAPEPKG